MDIVVLNGSPKSRDLSVTMQYVTYIQNKYPQHTFKVFDISREIKLFEDDEKALSGLTEVVRAADGVLWAFPVYIWLIPSQYKRFIELVFEKKLTKAFSNKYAAALSTSIHFFDTSALEYINAISDDLGMRYLGAFSADMYDLLWPKERERLRLFADHFFDAILNKAATAARYNPVVWRIDAYEPGRMMTRVDTLGKKIVIVTDSTDSGSNVHKMVDRFRDSFSGDVDVVNLNTIDIKGGCVGCLSCTVDNVCIYKDRDQFTEFYNSILQPADVIVMAGTIRDRYLSSRWKLFFDRSFFYNHIPSLVGKQIGFIISGPLNQVPGLRQILEAHIALHRSNLVDFVTDENAASSDIDARLHSLAYQLIRFSENGYRKAATFLDVAGMKIFRDNVWGRLRIVLQADHNYYTSHGFYDFPRRNIKTRLMDAAIIYMNRIPALRRSFTGKIAGKMVEPLKKVLGIRGL